MWFLFKSSKCHLYLSLMTCVRGLFLLHFSSRRLWAAPSNLTPSTAVVILEPLGLLQEVAKVGAIIRVGVEHFREQVN